MAKLRKIRTVGTGRKRPSSDRVKFTASMERQERLAELRENLKFALKSARKGKCATAMMLRDHAYTSAKWFAKKKQRTTALRVFDEVNLKLHLLCGK